MSSITAPYIIICRKLLFSFNSANKMNSKLPNRRETNILRQIYEDASSPGGFGSIEMLYKEGKNRGLTDLNRDKVRRFSNSQQSYTIMRLARKRYPRDRVYYES